MTDPTRPLRNPLDANPAKFAYSRDAGTLRAVTPAQCSRCRNLLDGRLWTCKAFPNGIPAIILTNRFDHTQPYPGDNGIRFEPVDSRPA